MADLLLELNDGDLFLLDAYAEFILDILGYGSFEYPGKSSTFTSFTGAAPLNGAAEVGFATFKLWYGSFWYYAKSDIFS